MKSLPQQICNYPVLVCARPVPANIRLQGHVSNSAREAFPMQDLLRGTVFHITFEKSRTLRDSKDNLKLFCFKGRSSTFRLFIFRFIPIFIFFTRLLSAGHFYASVSRWTELYRQEKVSAENDHRQQLLSQLACYANEYLHLQWQIDCNISRTHTYVPGASLKYDNYTRRSKKTASFKLNTTQTRHVSFTFRTLCFDETVTL